MKVSPPDGGSPILVKAELTASLLERGFSLEEAIEQQGKLSSSGGPDIRSNGRDDEVSHSAETGTTVVTGNKQMH